MDYIKRKKKQLSQVRVFTNESCLKEYLVNDRIHVLLLNESIPVENVIHDNIKHICLLSEGNLIRENPVYPVIYKFQSADLVMQELFSYFPFDFYGKHQVIQSTSNVKVISVYSITRDIERMVFAYSLARQYAKGKKTLYINLDPFQALPRQNMQLEEKGLSELIYYLKQNPTNIIAKMNPIIQKDNSLDYIQGVTFGTDLYELTAEDIKLWVQELIKETEYQVVIFNVGCFFHAILELFLGSNQLLYVTGDSEMEQAKYQNFKNQLSWAGFDVTVSNMKTITLTKEEEERYRNITAEDLYSEEMEGFAYGYEII
jgi:hypothetical protein